METNLSKPNYYNVGDRSNIVVSNSFLSALNPEQGGSPQKALAFLDNNLEEKESKSIENGQIIHAYCENPKQFAVADVPKPGDMLGNMVDEFYKLMPNYSDQSIGDVEMVSKLKTDSGRAAENAATKASFEKLAGLLQLSYNPTVLLFRQARANTSAYKSYNEGTLVEKFIAEGIEYLKQLKELEGKLTLTAADKFTIESVKDSLYSNKLINKYWGLSNSFDTNIVWKELDIYFSLDLYGVSIACKARLDNIYIDITNKVIYINDLKTTSKPLGLFDKAVEYYRYYRQIAWYGKAVKEYFKNTDGPRFAEFKDYAIKYQIAAVETTGDFNSCIFDMEDYVFKGIKEAQSLVSRFYYHKKHNVWDQSMEQHKGGGVVKLIPKKENDSN